MSLQFTFRPIEQWPGEFTKPRKASPFRTSFSKTLKLLERELRYLESTQVVIQAHCDGSQIRRDGMLRHDAKLTSPAVILSFESKHGPLSYPCDKFQHWDCNLHAVALSLRALRTVDRYGVTRRAEQYRGWERLENKPSAVDQSAKVIANHSGYTVAEILSGRTALDEAFRVASIHTHPDRGGDAAEFKQVAAAYEFLQARVLA